MISRTIGGVTVSKLTQNEIEVRSIPALAAIFPRSYHSHDTDAVTRILFKLCIVWFLNHTIHVCVRLGGGRDRSVG